MDMTSDFASHFENRINSIFGDRMIDDFVHRELTPLSHLTEKASKWILEVDLPGVKKNNIDVSVTQNHVIIKAKLKEVYCVTSHDCITEFEYFKKVIELPKHVSVKNIAAKFANGILTIDIPKTTTGKKISVK